MPQTALVVQAAMCVTCVFAAISGPFETYGGAMTSCLMCLHWQSVAMPAAESAMLLLSRIMLERFLSLQSVRVTKAENGRSATSSLAREMTCCNLQVRQQQMWR